RPPLARRPATLPRFRVRLPDALPVAALPVAKVPLVGGRILAATAVELHRQRRVLHLLRYKRGYRSRSLHRYLTLRRVGATVRTRHCQRDDILPRLCVGVAWVRLVAALPVTEVPRVGGRILAATAVELHRQRRILHLLRVESRHWGRSLHRYLALCRVRAAVLPRHRQGHDVLSRLRVGVTRVRLVAALPIA